MFSIFSFQSRGYVFFSLYRYRILKLKHALGPKRNKTKNKNVTFFKIFKKKKVTGTGPRSRVEQNKKQKIDASQSRVLVSQVEYRIDKPLATGKQQEPDFVAR
ncbi:unnamed protein product [Laminaria digitata]